MSGPTKAELQAEVNELSELLHDRTMERDSLARELATEKRLAEERGKLLDERDSEHTHQLGMIRSALEQHVTVNHSRNIWEDSDDTTPLERLCQWVHELARE